MRRSKSMKGFRSLITSKGFSLTELLLVLGVLTLLVIAVFAVYASTQTKTSSTQEAQQLVAIQGNVRRVFGASRNYLTLTTALANQSHAFPATMNKGNFSASAPIFNIWGGAVSVFPAPDPSRFIVRYDGVPSSACVALMPNALAGASLIDVAGTTVFDVQDATATSAQKTLDLDALVDACNTANPVAIEWTYP